MKFRTATVISQEVCHAKCGRPASSLDLPLAKRTQRKGRVYRKVVVGTIEQFPTKTAAKRAVETFRSTINAVNPAVPVTTRAIGQAL